MSLFAFSNIYLDALWRMDWRKAIIETGKAVRIKKAVIETIRWFSPPFCFYSRHPFPPK